MGVRSGAVTYRRQRNSAPVICDTVAHARLARFVWIRDTRESTFTGQLTWEIYGRGRERAPGFRRLSRVDWTRGKKWHGSIRRIGGNAWESSTIRYFRVQHLERPLEEIRKFLAESSSLYFSSEF